MESNIGPGIMTTLFGVVMLVFHRKLAHQSAAFYQNWPELKESMLAWCGLLGGALAVVMGIASLANPDCRLASALFLVVGLAGIFLSDWNACRTIVWYQSEKYWRNVNLLIGLAVTIGGVLRLSHIIP